MSNRAPLFLSLALAAAVSEYGARLGSSGVLTFASVGCGFLFAASLARGALSSGASER